MLLEVSGSQQAAGAVLSVLGGIAVLAFLGWAVVSIFSFVADEPAVLLIIPAAALVIGLVGTAIFGHFLICLGIGGAVGLAIVVIMGLADM